MSGMFGLHDSHICQHLLLTRPSWVWFSPVMWPCSSEVWPPCIGVWDVSVASDDSSAQLLHLSGPRQIGTKYKSYIKSLSFALLHSCQEAKHAKGQCWSSYWLKNRKTSSNLPDKTDSIGERLQNRVGGSGRPGPELWISFSRFCSWVHGTCQGFYSYKERIHLNWKMDVGKTCLIGIQKDRQPLNTALKLIQLQFHRVNETPHASPIHSICGGLRTCTEATGNCYLFSIVKAVLLHKPVLFHHSSVCWETGMWLSKQKLVFHFWRAWSV